MGWRSLALTARWGVIMEGDGSIAQRDFRRISRRASLGNIEASLRSYELCKGAGIDEVALHLPSAAEPSGLVSMTSQLGVTSLVLACSSIRRISFDLTHTSFFTTISLSGHWHCYVSILNHDSTRNGPFYLCIRHQLRRSAEDLKPSSIDIQRNATG